jgi:hypothetical protein
MDIENRKLDRGSWVRRSMSGLSTNWTEQGKRYAVHPFSLAEACGFNGYRGGRTSV